MLILITSALQMRIDNGGGVGTNTQAKVSNSSGFKNFFSDKMIQLLNKFVYLPYGRYTWHSL